MYFPLAVFPLDSDGVLAGLCAFRIDQGHYSAFFPGGTRLSAASCYVASAFFHTVGAGRLGLALTGLTWGVLYLLFTLLLLNALFERRTAFLASLFAIVPSEQFMTITYIPWGYGEIISSCAATLWLSALWRSDGSLWRRFWFGVSLGFGIWISLQTLMIALPAAAWIVLKRRSRTVREAPVAALGAIVGAMPFLVANAVSGFPSLTQNWASRPASSLPHVWENLTWLITYPLPGLLFHGFSGWWSVSTLFVTALGLAAVGFAFELSRPNEGNDRVSVRDLCVLLALVAASCIALFIFSQAGSLRGWTVRYILPIYVIVPVFLGIGVRGLWRWNGLLAAGVAAALLVPNLMLYSLPGTQARAYYSAWLQTDARLTQLFLRRGVRMVYGDYFSVYHLNFDTDERIAAIPAYAPADYMGYGTTLGVSSIRWAMVGNLSDLHQWARAVGARGTIVPEGDAWVFLADLPAENAAALLARLQAQCRIGSCAMPFPK